MYQYKRKHPVNYTQPYTALPETIDETMKAFYKAKGYIANYIIVNDQDYPHLVKAYREAKVIPNNQDELALIQSARVIPSAAMREGYFDVVGN